MFKLKKGKLKNVNSVEFGDEVWCPSDIIIRASQSCVITIINKYDFSFRGVEYKGSQPAIDVALIPGDEITLNNVLTRVLNKGYNTDSYRLVDRFDVERY